MIEHIHFVLVCEGSSDENLVPHLRELLVHSGVKQATGTAPQYSCLPTRVSRNIKSRIEAALQLERSANLLFVHKDADSPDPNSRYKEIGEGIVQAGYLGFWIGVVPVQETEAWLLLDEEAIRRVAGRPNGTIQLNLPRPEAIETVSDAKRMLRDAIITASETTGRRRERIKRRFPEIRSRLLRELKKSTSLERLPSWSRLKNDIESFGRKSAVPQYLPANGAMIHHK